MKRTHTEDDDGRDPNVARDGETVRCPMMFMDDMQKSIVSARAGVVDAFGRVGHAPGPRYLAGDDGAKRKAQAREDYIRRITDAWRGPQRPATTDVRETDR